MLEPYSASYLRIYTKSYIAKTMCIDPRADSVLFENIVIFSHIKLDPQEAKMLVGQYFQNMRIYEQLSSVVAT